MPRKNHKESDKLNVWYDPAWQAAWAIAMTKFRAAIDIYYIKKWEEFVRDEQRKEGSEGKRG